MNLSETRRHTGVDEGGVAVGDCVISNDYAQKIAETARSWPGLAKKKSESQESCSAGGDTQAVESKVARSTVSKIAVAGSRYVGWAWRFLAEEGQVPRSGPEEAQEPAGMDPDDEDEEVGVRFDVPTETLLQLRFSGGTLAFNDRKGAMAGKEQETTRGVPAGPSNGREREMTGWQLSTVCSCAWRSAEFDAHVNSAGVQSAVFRLRSVVGHRTGSQAAILSLEPPGSGSRHAPSLPWFGPASLRERANVEIQPPVSQIS